MLFKNNLFLAVPIIALLVSFIFSLTLFPSVNPAPTNLPIAIVNEDEGIEIPNQSALNLGQTIVDTVLNSSVVKDGEEPTVKWIQVDSTEEVEKGLNNQKYYGALVIPKDFSEKQSTLQTAKPVSPEVVIFINQGMSSSASSVASQVLNGVVDNVNINMRNQILEGFEKQGLSLTVEQVELITSPITKIVTTVNAVGENSAGGNLPMSLFQPVWIASLLSAIILFKTGEKAIARTKKDRLLTKLQQILMSLVISFLVGFGFTWIAKDFVGFNIPNYLDTALFIMISCASFVLMISAVVSLVGFKGVPVFGLLLFFGGPLLSIPYEMLPSFYQNWVHPWLPIRFLTDGLRDIIYFGEGLHWSGPVSKLVYIGIVGMIVMILSSLIKPKVKEDKKEN